MWKRISAIVLIFAVASLAWIVLGATIFARTYSADSSLEGRVVSTWGAPHSQSAPSAEGKNTLLRTVEVTTNGRKSIRKEKATEAVPLPLKSSRIDVALDLDHRQKGLLWYSTYKVAFNGVYTFTNVSQGSAVTFTLPFPTSSAIYDDLVFTVDGNAVPFVTTSTGVTATAQVPPGHTAILQTSYRSQGLDTWNYTFGGEVTQVRDFRMVMKTDFRDIDFAENTLSPTEKRAIPGGWELTWTYKNLLSGYRIGMTLPQMLQPGPLAGQISYFAPVSLLFFFFIIFVVATLREIDLHPMNYFFLAGAFFAFHLLLAYLADHISIHAAFVIASLVSVFLVVSYLRLVVGIGFALREAGLAQLLYLVLFSYAFFFKGFTGLAITIGAILTLFVVMQATGRIRWSERFAAVPATTPPSGTPPTEKPSGSASTFKNWDA